ncbi:MAG: O-antigen ligase family protein [Deltaproteobacteria bacterium]|nr:O-antigen ligase family protein [Deltaproteobacteria bacterium]
MIRQREMAASEIRSSLYDRWWFYFAILYFIVDYVRPQNIFSWIGLLRPGAITITVLTIFIIGSRQIYLSDTRQTRLIWAFIILLFIHVPFAANNYYALVTAQNMLKLMPFIISVIILVSGMERLKQIVTIMVIIMVYMSLWSITHGGHGVGGWFGDENDLALYINAMMPFALHLYYHAEKRILKVLYIIVFILGIGSIIASFSRGGLVGLVAMVGVGWLLSRHKIRILFVVIVAAFAFFTYTSQEYREEMSTITDTQSGTIHGRFLMWEAAWDMFIDHPLGVGGSNFPVRFPDYQSEEFPRGMWGHVSHSLWFTLIPELGIPGIIIYFMLLWVNFKELLFLLRLRYEGDDPDLAYIQTLSLAFLASAAGFFASATGLSVLYYPHFWYLTALLVATRKITEARLEILSSSAEDTNGVTPGAIPLVQ